MNDKYSTATFCGVVLVALAVGVLVGKVALAPSPSAPQGPGGGIRERNFEAATAGESKEATIRLRDKGAKTCRSWLKGYADSYPRLSLSADSPKDSVDWTAQDEKGNPTDVVVTFFDINPNTGGPIAAETRLQRANQRIYHGGAHVSRLELLAMPPARATTNVAGVRRD